MSWLLTFWLITSNGQIFAHDTLHGFATQADCREFASHIPVHNGVVRYECTQESLLKPAVWYTESGL